MKNKLFNKLLSFGLSLSMVITPMFSSMSVYAESETNFNIEAQATTVNVTVPLNISVTINPNLEKESGGFIYGDVLVENGTKAPILVSISDFSSTDSPFENTINPDDLPGELEWDNLNAKQTMEYFSIGAKPIEYNSLIWSETKANDYTWALDDGFVESELGVLDAESNAYLGLDAFYGKSFKESKVFSYKATFVAELFDGEDTPGTHSVDEEGSSNLNYETENINPLFDIEEVYAAPVNKEIDESKIVGTAKISGVKDTSISDIYVADYYEDNSGNLYKIVGVKEGTNLSDCENLTSIIAPNSSIANALGNELSYNNVSNTTIKINGEDYVLDIEATPDNIQNRAVLYDENNYNNNPTYTFEVVDEANSYPSYQGQHSCVGYATITGVVTDETTKDIIIPSYYLVDGKYYYVTGIADYVLTYDDYVETIFIPTSITTIGNDSLHSNSAITSYSVSKDNTAFCSIDGVMYSKDLSTLLRFPTKKDSSTYLIPSNVTTIGKGAFQGNLDLNIVNISKNIVTISDNGFRQCNNLVKANFSKNTNLTNIGSHAFLAASFVDIEIPSTVTTIGNEAFMNVPNIIYNGSVENDGSNWGAKSLNGYVENGLVYSSDKSTLIVDSALVNGDVSILNGVTTISDGAFTANENITSITIPNSVTTIGNSAFSNCTGLTNITIPNSVESIGNSIFNGCTNLTNVTLSNKITTIPTQAFYNTSLTTVTIPSSVTTLGQQAFGGCANLINITFEEGSQLTSIEYSCFNNCTGLSEITIPSSVIDIKSSAFNGCTNLTTIKYSGSVENDGSNWGATNATVTAE